MVPAKNNAETHCNHRATLANFETGVHERDNAQRMAIAVRRGVSKALDRHKKLGESVVILRNGKVVTITAEDIIVPPYPDDSELEGI